ncbi:heterokaryon incompatibility protein-domain-containing protein [Nemania sp. FL0031]|nr:heterokaryon incompatibility protein-domain-containing protein [Nemania sp. FL0031]
MAFPFPQLPCSDALRLLTLKAGGFFAPLEADLVPVPFSDKPQYLALSYTWDDPTPDQSMLPVDFTTRHPDDNSGRYKPEDWGREATLALNGHKVPIKHNLALALRYLRSDSYHLTLWIDAVCINQNDIIERNAQVALMALIYSRATAVVTWLGLDKSGIIGSDQTLEGLAGFNAGMSMQRIYNQGNSKELALWLIEHMALKSSILRRNILEARDAEKDAIERMTAANQLSDKWVVKTSYWQRVWVVQEVCLAQKVFFVYGPTVFAEEQRMRDVHDKKKIKVASGMPNMLEARRLRFSNSMRLENLIEKFAIQMCTDPRDKIYGLVGLANDVDPVLSLGDSGVTLQDDGSNNVDFIIDYRRSFYDIWCDTIQYLFKCPYYFLPAHINQDESELRRLRHERLTNLVRFSCLVQNTLQDEVERELAQLITFSPTHEANTKLQGPELFPRHLVPARGYVAGKIVDLGPSYADFVGSSSHQPVWRAKCRKHYRKEVDLEQLRQTEARYAAQILNYSKADVARIALIDEDSFVAFTSEKDGPLDNITTSLIRADREVIMDNIAAKRLSKDVPVPQWDGEVCRFLATDLCMGLAPPGTAVGDWVIRFWDCDAAIVVRPEEALDPKSSCALIGRADVADIRDRKGRLGDTVGSAALSRNQYGEAGDKRIDMVMSWYTLQRITASIIT